MKILLLNPHIDAGHGIVKGLGDRSVGLLLTRDAEEAWKLLQFHGTSVDIAVIHREGRHFPTGLGSSETGIKLIAQIKANPAFADIPLILSSEVWSESDCGNHQQTLLGANAYLQWPFTETQLMRTIDAVFAPSSDAASQPPSFAPASALEDVSRIFERSESTRTQFHLDTSLRKDPQIEPLPAPDLPTAATEIRIEPPPLPVDLPKFEPTASIMLGSKSSADPRQFLNPARTDVSVLQGVEESESVPKEEDEEEQNPDQDPEAAVEMPYLFDSTVEGRNQEGRSDLSFTRAFAQPLGDAVVPGGAANAPDAEVLKKYLLLREQDVAVLSAQLKTAKDQLSAMEALLHEEKTKNIELMHTANEQKRKIEEFERVKEMAEDGLANEVNELRFQLKAKTDKVRLLNEEVREAAQEIEKLKIRVRSDIRKIRIREKELENRLEIVKKDSEALIGAREAKIVELKRKLDLLEFNMDLLQDQYVREKESSLKLREQLVRAAQAVRVAGGLLDGPRGEPFAANQSLESIQSEENKGDVKISTLPESRKRDAS